MGKKSDWIMHNKALLLVIVFVIFIGFLDTIQIQATMNLENTDDSKWDLYNQYTLPAWIALWVACILAIALMYYWATKDKSEAIGLFSAGFIMIFTGMEDIFYFLFSPQKMTACMQWLNDLNAPVSWWSKYILGEACVSPLALYTFSALGFVFAVGLFILLREKI